MTEGWERGFPPGKFYKGMTDDFEVYYSPGGQVWHRRKGVPGCAPAHDSGDKTGTAAQKVP